MRANRGVNSVPERRLRTLLHARGLRYRINLRLKVNGVAVRPDIVFTRSQVAVFVDGCFWHGCPEHMSWPKSNREFWRAKVERTQERDREQDCALKDAGWTVVRIWEHECVEAAAIRVQTTISNMT